MIDFSKHIMLVVDDEPDNVDVFKASMEMLYDATVKSAQSGAEALSLLATVKPTIIVTDLSMPKMDGYVLLHELRLRPESKNLPIIAITAHAMRGDKENILSAGFDGYISKPFDISTIADDLDKYLQAFEAKQAASAGPILSEVSQVSVTAPTSVPTAISAIINGESHAA